MVVKYSLVKQADVSLRLYDLRGREVFSGINKVQSPGEYTFCMPTAGFSRGTYVQVLKAGSFVNRSAVTLTR